MNNEINDTYKIVLDFLTKYLDKERNYSHNTISSYTRTMTMFINFLKTEFKINDKKVSILDFTREKILSFLNYLEEERKCKPITRNHALAVINSFLEYASYINTTYAYTYLEAKKIKQKKANLKVVDFLTLDEYKAFLKLIDIKTKTGYKEFIIVNTLYETACRVSELINIKYEDFDFFSEHTTVRILGKGNKQRLVTIGPRSSNLIKEFCLKMSITKGYIFLSSSTKNKYTRRGISHIIAKYGEIAKEKIPTLQDKAISPHVFRHTRAVHFLLNNTSIYIIQHVLGHKDISTTQMYLAVTSDVVIKAVEDISSLIDTSKQETKSWKEDKSLIAQLNKILATL